MQSDASAPYRDSSADAQDASPRSVALASARQAGIVFHRDASVLSVLTSGPVPGAEAVGRLGDRQLTEAGFDNQAHADLLKRRLCTPAQVESLPGCGAAAQASQARDFPLVPVRPVERRFHMAACHGSEAEMRQLLQQAPFHVDDLDVFGRSALHIAAERGHMEPVRRLLGGLSAGNGIFDLFSDRGVVLPSVVAAEVNLATQFGVTPAHYAAAHGQVGVLELLHSHGADLCAPTEFQATPLDLARAHGQVQAEFYLRQMGAYSAGPIWRPSEKFTDSLSAWRRAWHDLAHTEGRGGNDDFLSAMFGSARDGLVWPMTPGMKEDLALFRRKWRRHADQSGEFDRYEFPVYLEGGRVTASWSLPLPLAHEMDALHQRWRDDVLAGLLGVPSWWVQQMCEPHQPGQVNSPQSHIDALPQVPQSSGRTRGRKP